MNRRTFSTLGIVVAWLAAEVGASGQQTNSATAGESPKPGTNASASVTSSRDYASFRMINDRNIFNSRRRARTVLTRTVQTETPRYSRADTLALVGTLTYDKGPIAFFDGSSSQYKQAVKPGETVGGITVSEISPNSVKMVAGTNHLQLSVGMQLRREPEGDWQEAGQAEVAAAERPAPHAETAVVPEGTPDPTAPPADGELPSIAIDPDTGLPVVTFTPAPASDSGTQKTEVKATPGSAEDTLARLRRQREQESQR